MFIPQDVRTCQEFNPKVYEIPKYKLKELQERGELDAEALEPIQLEEYRQSYIDQPIQNVLDAIERQKQKCMLTSGDAITLFDGIDKVFDPNWRDVVVTDIHRFTNNYPTVQTVVTSRWLGYKAQTLRDAGFQHYILQDLTDDQIAEFIQRWHNQLFLAAGCMITVFTQRQWRR